MWWFWQSCWSVNGLMTFTVTVAQQGRNISVNTLMLLITCVLILNPLFLGSVVFWWNWWNALFILPATAALCGLFLICSDLWLRNTFLLIYCDVCLTFSEGLMTDKSYSSSSLLVATNQSGMQFNVHHLPVWYLCSQKGMLLLLFSIFETFVWAFMSVYRIGSRQENKRCHIHYHTYV